MWANKCQVGFFLDILRAFANVSSWKTKDFFAFEIALLICGLLTVLLLSMGIGVQLIEYVPSFRNFL